MKNIILICICIIFTTTISCYKTEIETQKVEYYSLSDKLSFGDTISYYMYCGANNDSVKLRFIKENYVIKNKYEGPRRDTIIVLIEEYNYSHKQFKSLLKEKAKIVRERSFFKFTNNMYCSWFFFDEMYNKTFNK